MKKIEFVEKGTRSHWLEYKNYAFSSYYYDAKYDFENGVYYTITDEEYKNVGFPTLNDLIKSGELKEVEDGYTVEKRRWSRGEDMTPEVLASIVEEFRANGFNVTEEAVMHNFNCWRSDLKSGFRGEDFFLFSPCGCNELRFDASHLYDADSSWQNTYEA